MDSGGRGECGLPSSFSIGRSRPEATLSLAGSSSFTAAVAIIRVISRAAVPVVSRMAGGVAAVTSLHR